MPVGDRVDLTRATFVDAAVHAAVDQAFDYHSWDAGQIEAGRVIRETLKDAFRAIINGAPPCPDRSTALRKLREARMDANSAITHHGRY